MLRSAVFGCDRSLEPEWAGIGTKGLFDQRQRLNDLLLIPKAAILVFEQNEIPRFIDAGVAARVMQQHERQQAGGLGRRFSFGSRRHEGQHEAAEPDGFRGQIGPDEPLAAGSRIALVEDEIDYGEHGLEALRNLVCLGDLVFGPHQPLGHGGRRHQKCPGNLVRLESAESAEREGNLRLWRQGRVATGENEAQAFVGNLACLLVWFRDGA
jgi:hypothetical protein